MGVCVVVVYKIPQNTSLSSSMLLLLIHHIISHYHTSNRVIALVISKCDTAQCLLIQSMLFKRKFDQHFAYLGSQEDGWNRLKR
jgi:Na+-transporting NADH:ubiquinone oxidoreductase subunit NqrB